MNVITITLLACVIAVGVTTFLGGYIFDDNISVRKCLKRKVIIGFAVYLGVFLGCLCANTSVEYSYVNKYEKQVEQLYEGGSVHNLGTQEFYEEFLPKAKAISDEFEARKAQASRSGYLFFGKGKAYENAKTIDWSEIYAYISSHSYGW